MKLSSGIVMVVAAVLVLVQIAESKIFERCELARELKRQGFPQEKLRDWVCLVESESSRNSGRIGKRNRNGSVDYGLFQINDKYWCTHGAPGKDCNVKCEDLLLDDITKASTCAKKVFRRHGFGAWYGWKNKCQGVLPDISSCGV